MPMSPKPSGAARASPPPTATECPGPIPERRASAAIRVSPTLALGPALVVHGLRFRTTPLDGR